MNSNLFSIMSNPFGQGQAVFRSGSSWVAKPNDDFFFRVYFQSNPAPTPSIVQAGFTAGNGRGFVVTDSGVLTTDAKLLALFLVDDTASVSWSDPSSLRKTEIPNLITTLFNRTPSSVSYGDFWIFSDTELERSQGFTNSLTDLQTFGAALFARGNNSSLYDSAPLAISGLGVQSVVDAIIKVDDVENITRVNTLVTYLQARSILNLTSVVSYWNSLPSNTRSLWGSVSGGNQQASTIANYGDVSTFVVKQWAQSFTPVGFIIADGDDNGIGTPNAVLATAQSAWGDDGVPTFTFGLGHSHNEHGLRTISVGTGAKHFDISTDSGGEDDWTLSTTSLLHGGANSLFTAHWGRLFDYNEPTFISIVSTTFSSPSMGSLVNIDVRWTYNRVDWTPWHAVQSGVDLNIQEEVLAFEYRVQMTDGWNSGTSQPVRPTISVLQHTTVSPSIQYLITPPQNINGMMFETLLSATADLPKSARAQWGIVRGDSTDFADFEIAHNGRKGALPNRQQSLQFTPQKVRALLSTTTTDNTAYQVIDGGSAAKWTASDVVQVYAGQALVDPTRAAYSLDGDLGIVYFAGAQPPSLVVKVTITTPQKLYSSIGEPTTTRDNRTYYLANGRWPHDALVIVLINGTIKRGGYFANAEEGTVTFLKEREKTDLVTVFIQHAGTYRVAVEIRNFAYTLDISGNPVQTPVTIDNFGLFFTTLGNNSLIAQYNSPITPHLLGNSAYIQPSAPTIYQRLTIDYTFVSVNGSEEQGTQTAWWRYRPGESTGGYTDTQTINSHVFVHITAANGLPEYDNRITERKQDIGSSGLFQQGDQVFVTVSPSDGFTTGAMISSAITTMRGNQIPFVENSSLQITSPSLKINIDGVATSKAGDVLTATYKYHNPDNSPDTSPDNSLVEWFIKDSSLVVSTGLTVASGVTKRDEVYVFRVTPNNGQVQGIPAYSGYVTIT